MDNNFAAALAFSLAYGLVVIGGLIWCVGEWIDARKKRRKP